MTDRDFKLLVRAYFQLIDKWKKSRYIYKEEYAQDLETLEKQIRAELSRFTQQEIEELPFTFEDKICRNCGEKNCTSILCTDYL